MLTITVQGDLEDRLKRAADSAQLDPQVVAERVLDAHLPEPNQSSLDLLAKWEAEESTTDPAELARRQSEGEQFMQNLAANRKAAEGPNARQLWP
jgi:hypothetical protein